MVQMMLGIEKKLKGRIEELERLQPEKLKTQLAEKE